MPGCAVGWERRCRHDPSDHGTAPRLARARAGAWGPGLAGACRSLRSMPGRVGAAGSAGRPPPAGAGGPALAATVALGVVLVPAFQSGSTREALAQDQELDEVIARSRQLEDLIQS